MTNEIENQLINDKEIIEFLKSAILEKAKRYDLLLKIKDRCSDSRIDQILGTRVKEDDIRLIFKRFEADIEMRRLEIDLANMCYSINSKNRSHDEITSWEQAYEHATKFARIENIVRLLTGEENFNRNIKCPFHDDSKASLKIYVKNNRFICFGCEARGSPIDFVMQYQNCPFREAVLFLSNF